MKREKFKLRTETSFLRTFSFLSSAANSFGTSLGFAAFGSNPYAKHSRASALCLFFCPQPWFLRWSEHIFPGKHPCLSQFSNSRHSLNSRNIESSRSTYRLNSRHLAAVPTSNKAEPLPSGFFSPQSWFSRRSEHIFPRKTPLFISSE